MRPTPSALPSRVGLATGLTGWTNFRLRLRHTPGGSRSGSWNALGRTGMINRRRIAVQAGRARLWLNVGGGRPPDRPGSRLLLYPVILDRRSQAGFSFLSSYSDDPERRDDEGRLPVFTEHGCPA